MPDTNLHQYYLGIDVGKFTHQATLVDRQGLMVGESFKFQNSRPAFEYLLERIKKQLPDEATVAAGVESTGHYYWHLRDYLEAHGVPVRVINPIETQSLSRTKVRPVKNDRVDSLLIANITKQKGLRASASNLASARAGQDELRQLTRFAEKLKGQERYYKQEITVLLERLAPEIFSYVSNIFLKTSLQLIAEYFIKQRAAGTIIPKLVRTSRGRLSAGKAADIVKSLPSSLGQDYVNEYSRLQLKFLLTSLQLAQNQIKEIKAQITKHSQARFRPEIDLLVSIKGVSPYMAAVCLAEIGSIERFKDKPALIAFAGLDPSVKQSGTYTRKQGNHISKRGSKHLRRQLYYAAKTAIMFDPELKNYYLKKKSQGKHYNVIVIAVARKILIRIWAVLKQKRPYELRIS
jgi:transposase